MFSRFKPAFTASTYKKMFYRHYLQLFLIYTAVFLLAEGLFFYQSYQHKKELLCQSAESLCEFSDGLLRECQTVAFNVGKLASLQILYSSSDAALTFSSTDSTTFFKAQHDLVSQKALSKHVSSMSIYLNHKEYIISDYGTITLDNFCRNVFNMDSDAFQDYLKPLTPGYYLFVPRSELPETNASRQSLCILPISNGTGGSYGLLFLFLNDTQILKELHSTMRRNMEYYIVGKDQTLLFHSGPQGNFLTTDTAGLPVKSNKYISTTDPYSGWTHYVGYAPAFVRNQRILQVVILTLLFLAGSVLLTPFVNAICKKSYAPIRELSSLLADTGAEQETDPEYETLKNTVTGILENKVLLEQQLSLYRPMLVNSFLLELLGSNTEDHSQVLRGLSSLGVELPFTMFFCIALAIPSLSHNELCEIARDLTTSTSICLSIICKKQTGVLFFNSTDNHQALLSLQTATSLLEQNAAISTYGIGSVSEGLRHAPLSYSQSLCSLDYFSVQDTKGISLDTLFSNNLLNLPLPEHLKSLDASFAACRFQTARENASEFFRMISRSGYGKKEHLVYAREQLLLAIRKLPADYQAILDTEALYSFNKDHIHAFDLLQMQYREMLDALLLFHEQSSSELALHASGQLLDWLDNHLCDENLSLSCFAEAFSLSESNMSRKIRTLTGENFLSYVNRRRIEHACLLLKTTNDSVLHIARVSGYENDITFRRIFKKYMGMTPGEYRIQFTN